MGVEKPKSVCVHCGRAYSNNSNLYKHIRAMHDIVPDSGKKSRGGDFKCHVCHQSMSQKSVLTRHLKNIHGIQTEKKSFPCDRCSKSFQRKVDLVKHVKQNHLHNSGYPLGEADMLENEDSEGFLCEYCCEVFEFQKDLHCHLQSQHDVREDIGSQQDEEAEQRLPCHVCSNTFVNKSSLHRHLKTMHGIEAPKSSPTGRCPFYPKCNVKVNHGDSVMCHLKEDHDVIMDIEEQEFNSYEAFVQWKDGYCNETLTQYAQPRGAVTMENDQRFFLNCHRSGKKRSQGMEGCRKSKRLAQNFKKQKKTTLRKYKPDSISRETKFSSSYNPLAATPAENREVLNGLLEEIILVCGQLTDEEKLKQATKDAQDLLKCMLNDIHGSGVMTFPALA